MRRRLDRSTLAGARKLVDGLHMTYDKGVYVPDAELQKRIAELDKRK